MDWDCIGWIGIVLDGLGLYWMDGIVLDGLGLDGWDCIGWIGIVLDGWECN